MTHLNVVILAGIGIAIAAIGINVYLWNDEVALTTTVSKSSQSGTSPNLATSAPPKSGATVKALSEESARKVTKSEPRKLNGPTFDTVRVGPDGSAVIAGRGQPHSTILIFDNETFMGEVNVDKNGEWVFVPKTPLAPGNRQISLKQRLKGQENSIMAGELLMIVVPEKNKDIAKNLAESKTQALALKFPRNNDGPSILLQKPTPEDRSIELSLDTVDYDENGRLHISGRGSLKHFVQIYLDDLLIGRTLVDINGGWRLKPENPVAPGIYKLRVDEINKLGNVKSRIELPFARAKPSNSMPPEPMLVVQPGNSLWRLARRVYGEGIRFTTIYAANKNQIKDPDLIYPGQVFAIPTIN